MNRDDIRRIAKEAGLAGAKLSAGLEEMRLDMWERFAELVAAAEREACAQIVQSECIGFTPEDDQLNCIVAAIRARSIQPPKGED